MNSEMAHRIVKLVDGWEAEDGLSTVGISMIFLCHCVGLSKRDMLDALSMQWDLYDKQMRAIDQRERRKKEKKEKESELNRDQAAADIKAKFPDAKILLLDKGDHHFIGGIGVEYKDRRNAIAVSTDTPENWRDVATKLIRWLEAL